MVKRKKPVKRVSRKKPPHHEDPHPSKAKERAYMELRARELLGLWQYHRGFLPVQLVDALTNLRNAMRQVDGDPGKQYTRKTINKPPPGG